MNHYDIIYVCMLVCHASGSIPAERAILAEDSYQTKCPGPLAFYTAIGCKPIENDDGCAEQYDCDHVKSLPWNKCYVNGVNGRSYEVGERLKDEDANPCDVGCTCISNDIYDVSQFNCAKVDCFLGPPTPGCYKKNSPLNCCPGEEVCPENPEDRATCTVGGKTYLDGQYFSVESDPDLTCVCQPGYEGENVEPFCAKPKHPHCNPLFNEPYLIKNNCAPVYYSSQSPQTSCAVKYRCQNDQDKVIRSNESIETEESDSTCHFGSLEMQIGDELNQATDDNSVCVKCVCEVPPTPTCQRLPDNECDVQNIQTPQILFEISELQ